MKHVKSVHTNVGSFNLSILECKWALLWITGVVRNHVLIYPYWNVNEGGWTTQWEDGAVLIYPYWNVNPCSAACCALPCCVLIYPYWNVNLFLQLLLLLHFNRFNLSILECKSGTNDPAGYDCRSFNLSILECKFVPAVTSFASLQSF